MSIEKSIAEILEVLRKGLGSDENYGHFQSKGIHTVAFSFRGRTYQMRIIPASPDGFRVTETGRQRKEESVWAEVDQETRRRARVLLLCVKAKLEAAALGITTVEEEFLGGLVLPSGQTMGQWALDSPKLTQEGEPDLRLMLPAGRRGE